MNIRNVKTIERMTALDTRALRWLITRPNASATARWARHVSRLGDGPAYAALGAVLALIGGDAGKQFLAVALLAFLIELPVYLLLKNTIRRSRPADAMANVAAFIKPSDKFSFPSGHTAAAFVMATLLTAFYPQTIVLVYPVAMLIGVSRVSLGVHFPTDIAAGAVLGLACAAVALMLI